MYLVSTVKKGTLAHKQICPFCSSSPHSGVRRSPWWCPEWTEGQTLCSYRIPHHVWYFWNLKVPVRSACWIRRTNRGTAYAEGARYTFLARLPTSTDSSSLTYNMPALPSAPGTSIPNTATSRSRAWLIIPSTSLVDTFSPLQQNMSPVQSKKYK